MCGASRVLKVQEREPPSGRGESRESHREESGGGPVLQGLVCCKLHRVLSQIVLPPVFNRMY
jgi:hypothetical protein